MLAQGEILILTLRKFASKVERHSPATRQVRPADSVPVNLPEGCIDSCLFVPANLPEGTKGDARDQAGKANLMKGDVNPVKANLPERDKGDARDQAGKGEDGQT